MKIIFLDIDGVLNSKNSMRRAGKCIFNDNPDPIHIKWLNYIIEKTGAVVVISSVWRKNCSSSYIWRLLALLGFKGEVQGSTPSTGDIRGNEIRCWIDRYNNGKDWHLTDRDKKLEPIESFVILDDDADMGNFANRLVQCENENGLTKKEAEKAIKILNNDVISNKNEVVRNYHKRRPI